MFIIDHCAFRMQTKPPTRFTLKIKIFSLIHHYEFEDSILPLKKAKNSSLAATAIVFTRIMLRRPELLIDD